jgi:uncharacterized protein (UPF0335 family)
MSTAHLPSSIDACRMRSIVEQIEAIEDEVRSKLEDRKSAYAKAKAQGFDTKVLKRLVRERQRDQGELELEENTLSLYRRALAHE